MESTFFGYVRVSSIDQNDIRQRIELAKYGIVETNIYADKLSGKDFKRPKYQTLRKLIREGDVLVIKSLDRLGRNYIEIQEEWRYLTKAIKADIVVIDMPILDTRTNKDLLGTLISDIVLQLLSYVAEAERDNIRIRQAEGIAAAKALGKHLGRPSSPYPRGFEEIHTKFLNKEINSTQASHDLNISINSFNWLARKRKLGIEEVIVSPQTRKKNTRSKRSKTKTNPNA